MKLLVFAHTPPPHHGQSHMVEMLIEGFGGDLRKAAGDLRSPCADVPDSAFGIECYHVNCRYSGSLGDVGSVRLGKVWLAVRYALEAVWCRFRYGVRTFYYVPAPGKRAALYRDWIVMLFCRPFFREMIHHWHAAGLGEWLQDSAHPLERWLSRKLLGRPALGVALAVASMRDAVWFESRNVRIVPNGVRDPFPDFADAVLPDRQARLQARRRLLQKAAAEAGNMPPASSGEAAVFQVLYLAHGMREKGIFDVLDGVALANAQLRESHSPLRCRLTVAGLFPRADEDAEFRVRIAQPDLAGAVQYAGFVENERKRDLLRSSDCLCFPTYYNAETFGLVVVEAMAAGLCVVTTPWRALPELLPPDYLGFVPVRDPAAIAQALVKSFTEDGTALREVFGARFTESAHLTCLAEALRVLEE